MLILLSLETVTTAFTPKAAWMVAAIDCTVWDASLTPWVRAAAMPITPRPPLAAVGLPRLTTFLVRPADTSPVLFWVAPVVVPAVKPRITEASWRALTLTFTDRKSTRLNSSHLGISYAVFCLKKKNKQL